MCAQGGRKCVNDGRGGWKRRWRRMTVPRGHVCNGLRGMCGIERVRKQHGVVDSTAQLHAQAVQRMVSELGVVRALGHRRIFQQRSQFVRERQAQRGAGDRAHTHAGVCFALGGFHGIQQREHRPLARFVFLFLRGRLLRVERESKAVLACGCVEGCGLLVVWVIDQFDRIGGRGRRQFPEQRCELKLGEQLTAGFHVGQLRFHRGQVQVERHVAVDGDQFL